jgi:hypothetical protein
MSVATTDRVSQRPTSRGLAVHEVRNSAGWATEIAAGVAAQVFAWLDGPAGHIGQARHAHPGVRTMPPKAARGDAQANCSTSGATP